MTSIKFEDVSKKFKIYGRGGLYLRDRITHFLHSIKPFNWRSTLQCAKSVAKHTETEAQHQESRNAHSLERDFWALKNVSFEIKPGEAVGFIGRNGAGKSTILKLLAGVMKPTSGDVRIRGRVAALIEVGAGFHPELTGRENIYLNGSILGMRTSEINKAFDRIVEFAELKSFIDTPVKHYSSGMYVRLGFAIAAHTDPDIFLIDEVLAVGDVAFQAKCVQALLSHRNSGKSMILVSHDLNKIQEACDRCIYIHHGKILFDGTPRRAISRYRDDLLNDSNSNGFSQESDLGAKAQVLGVVFRDSNGKQKSEFCTGEDLIIEIRYRANRRIEKPVFGLAIHGPGGVQITGFNTRTSDFAIPAIEDEGAIYWQLNKLPLRDGLYYVSVQLHNYEDTESYDVHERSYCFEVTCGQKFTAGILCIPGEWRGVELGKWGREVDKVRFGD